MRCKTTKLSNRFLIADKNLFFPFFTKIYFCVPHHKYPVNSTQHMQSSASYSTVFIRTCNETEYAACNCCFYQICLPFLHQTNSSRLITTNSSFCCNLFSPFYDYTKNTVFLPCYLLLNVPFPPFAFVYTIYSGYV